MKKAILMSFILLLAISAMAQTRTSASRAVAFVNVNVIPMDRERVLRKVTTYLQPEVYEAIVEVLVDRSSYRKA